MIFLIDLQKTFDSVSFRFLELTLEVFGFGPNYRKWISILLRGFSACTIVNGNISERFAIKRGYRQGSPILGYLFILCIEIFALALRNSKAKPYQTPQGYKHLQEQYADDLTIFLEYIEGKDNLNVQNLKHILSVLDNSLYCQVWVLIKLRQCYPCLGLVKINPI